MFKIGQITKTYRKLVAHRTEPIPVLTFTCIEIGSVRWATNLRYVLVISLISLFYTVFVNFITDLTILSSPMVFLSSPVLFPRADEEKPRDLCCNISIRLCTQIAFSALYFVVYKKIKGEVKLRGIVR